MKKFLLAIAFVSFAFSASAQRAVGRSTSFFSTAKPDQTVILGIRAGVNIASISGLDAQSTIGFNAGLSADFPIVESFYFQTGLYFSMKGAEEKYFDYEDYGTTKLNPYYLEIPLLASYRFNFSERTQLQVNLGPYIAVGLGGKVKDTDSYGTEEWPIFGNDSNVSRFDLGWQIGAGVTFSRIYVGFNYGFGFMNMLKESSPNYSWKNSNFSINVGYNF